MHPESQITALSDKTEEEAHAEIQKTLDRIGSLDSTKVVAMASIIVMEHDDPDHQDEHALHVSSVGSYDQLIGLVKEFLRQHAIVHQAREESEQEHKH